MSNSGSGRYACSSQRSVTDDRIHPQVAANAALKRLGYLFEPDLANIFRTLDEAGLRIAWADDV